MRKFWVWALSGLLGCALFAGAAQAVMFKQQNKDYVSMNVLTADERASAFRSCQHSDQGNDHGPVKVEIYLDMRDPTDIQALRIYPIEGGEQVFTNVTGISWYKSFASEGLNEAPGAKGVYANPATEDLCFGFQVEYYNHTDFLP